MIELVRYYNKGLIARLTPSELEAVLFARHECISIVDRPTTVLNQGTLLLSNNDTIKCVSNYYRLADGSKNPKRRENKAALCYETRRHFGFAANSTSMNFSCQLCHVHCLDELSANRVIRT